MSDFERGQFTFYKSYYDALKDAPKSTRLQLYDAICEYALYGEEPTLTGAAKLMFSLIRPTLDSGRKKAKSGAEGGKKSKARESKPEANGKQTESKRKASRKQSESKKEGEKEKEKEIEKEREKESESSPPIPPSLSAVKVSEPVKAKIPPSVDEVREYCLERKNGIDPEQFVAFYQSKGWKVGKEPMKDWKSAVITWEKRRKEEGANGKPDGQYSAAVQKFGTTL